VSVQKKGGVLKRAVLLIIIQLGSIDLELILPLTLLDRELSLDIDAFRARA